MFYRAVAATCPGKDKEYNSNNIYLNSKYITEEYKSSEILLRQKREQEGLQFYAIAEGFGAERYADEASLITVKKLAELHAKVGKEKIGAEYDEAADVLYSYMEEFVKNANESVTSKATELSNKDVLASVAAVGIYEKAIITCNLGNTRIFLFRKGTLSKLSEEQNHAYMMFKNGIIDSARLETHSKRNKLTQYLGILPDEMQPEPYYSEAEVKHGDIFVICSSSFCENVSEDSICEMIKSSKSLSQIIDKMMTAAAAKGFEKDTSVMVIRADSHEKVVAAGGTAGATTAAVGAGAAKNVAAADKEVPKEEGKGTFLDKVKKILGLSASSKDEKIWPALLTFICCILVVIVLVILGIKIYNSTKDPGGSDKTPVSTMTALVTDSSGVTPTAEPTDEPNETAIPTANPTGTPNETATPTANPTGTPNETATPTANPTGTPEETATPTAQVTQTPTPTPTHAPSEEWTTDEDSHWHECECGEKFDVGEHIGGEANCDNKAVCETCKKEYGEFNKTNHTGETELKGYLEPSYEAPGYTGDTHCKDCGELLEKGTEIPQLHEHTPSEEWVTDEDKHWHECECGEKFDEGEHTGGEANYDNKAVCEKCKKEYGELASHKDDDMT